MKKVLVFGEQYFNFVDSTAYAFEQLGYEVQKYYIPVLHKTDFNFVDHIKYKMKCQGFFDKFYQAARNGLLKLVEEYEPDIVFSINGNSYYEFVDKAMLDVFDSKGITKIIWYMDTIKRFEHIKQNVEKFDKILVFEPNDVAYIKEKYMRGAQYLPIGVSEELYCRGESNIEKIYDISFVGNTTGNRLEILDKVAEYCVKNKALSQQMVDF